MKSLFCWIALFFVVTARAVAADSGGTPPKGFSQWQAGQNYGDFELRFDSQADALAKGGIDLRGAEIPLVNHESKPGPWRSIRIVMVGSRAWVWVNGNKVADGARVRSASDINAPPAAKGPIELRQSGGQIHWRNAFVREIRGDEADGLLRGKDPAGFVSVFNGRDFTGWAGPLTNCDVKFGTIVWKRGDGGTIYTKDEYSNFVVRVEFKLPPGGNNGLAIRYPGEGDTAYVGMCESQVLDDNYEKATGEKIDPRQAHGSAYGMVAALRGYQHPIGEWNYEEVTVEGSTIRVELNGTIILDTDLATVTNYLDGKAHPGKDRTSGHFGFAGHNDPVVFRGISIMRLE